MELQFDKEIDAILRKARVGVADGAVNSGHIDADAVAAFAENALPEKARALYMEHFADCGRCRKLLAQAMPWPPAEGKAVSVAAPVVASPIPWYSRLFRTPGLAMGLGALVLVFGGLLAFLVINKNSQNATVSQVMNSETRADAPYSAGSAPAAAANSNTVASNAAANLSAGQPQPQATPGSTSAANSGRGPANEPSSTASGFATDGVDEATSEKSKAGDAPPPPATRAEQPADGERKDDADKTETSRDAKASKEQEDRMAREAAPAPSKKVAVGPNRGTYGPRQNNQQNVATDSTNQGMVGGAMAPTPIKTAGGKKFEKRDGVWYDTAYHGQSTRNYARGTEDYKKLDDGLRSIASKIGGVVVIVWNGSVYRIQ